MRIRLPQTLIIPLFPILYIHQSIKLAIQLLANPNKLGYGGKVKGCTDLPFRKPQLHLPPPLGFNALFFLQRAADDTGGDG